jgi:tetratricopeptide (TPR) repeat protein
MPESSRQATSASPLIIISYSKEDEKWKDQLVSLLATDVDLHQLMFNRVEDEPQSASSLVSQLVRIDEKLMEREVLVLLLSPSYLRTSWILTEETDRVLELERQYGLTILPFLLHDYSPDDVPFLRNRRVITSFGKSIAEASSAEQTKALKLLVFEILRAAGLPEPPPQKSSEQISSSSSFRDTVPAKELEKFRWTAEVDKILDGAKDLGLDQDGRTTISAQGLLFAFAEAGRAKPSNTKAPQFLWSEITRHNVTAYESAFKSAFPLGRTRRSRKGTTRPSLRLTPNAVKILNAAASISRQTIKLEPPRPDIPPPLSDGHIAARHLLAALMGKPYQEPTINFTGLTGITDLNGLRQRFFYIIEKSNIVDDRGEWRDILRVDGRKSKSTTAHTPEPEQDSEPQGHIEGIPVSVLSAALDEALQSEEVSSKSVDPETPVEPVGNRAVSLPETEAELEEHIESQAEEFLRPVLAGFATDYWSGEDLLNIEGDVNALASLVSAWSVEPPLSIGLFGDWGSGKSHFMRQMRQQVERLSRTARNSPKKQNEIGYYKNIVQIEFNAWHYIEGNLWASLVDHIFANLRVSEKEKLSIVEARRDDLMNKLGVKKEIESKLKSKIEERKTELIAKRTDAIARAADAGNRKDEASSVLAGFRSEAESQLNQLKIPISFSDEDQKLLQRFGIQPSALQTAGDVRKQYQKAKTFWNRISTQWKLFWTDPKVKRRWFFAALLALIPLAGGYLLIKVPEAFKLPAGVVGALGFIATFLNAAKPTWDQFRKGLKTLEDQDEAIELERQKRIAELQGEVNALTKTVVDAENEAKSIRTEITDLEDQINKTTTSKILAEFIEDRAAASDYRRHLGLLALIRRDFEKLRDLFDQQRIEEKEGQETHDQNRINRIILYIDDLDRCGPQRVVEVLQAIHLLLAFPIFVVVVGVDARWVTRSLQESYEWLRLEDDDDRKKETNDDSDERGEQGATPHDYLEKIFQIPFWLAPMEETQCKTFIEGLTEQVRYKPSDIAVAEHLNGSKRTETGAPPTMTVLESTEVEQETTATGNGAQTAGHSDVERSEKTQAQLNTASVSTAGEDSGNNRASARLRRITHDDSQIARRQALTAYEEIINQYPHDLVAKNGRADVLKAMGRFEEALSAYEETINQHPDNLVAKNGRADVLKAMGRFKEALSAYEETINQHPDDPVAKNGRAEVLKLMGQSVWDDLLEKPSNIGEVHPDNQPNDGDEKIDLSPQSLTLGDKEIEYMTSLAKLIGRSPRAVKRFLNCYRLIKVSLPPAKLKKFVQDGASYEYRAVMILLGVITGTPTTSPYVIEELENWTWDSETPPTVNNFLNKLEGNTDLKRTADWSRLKAFLSGFDKDSAEMFAAIRAITPRVSRFSFRIARVEAAGLKRPSAGRRSKGPQPAGLIS